VTVTTEGLMTEPEPVRQWDGEIGIEWPHRAPGKAYPGWSTAPFNADGPITTIMAFTLYCRADDILWAEAEMLTDEGGQPIYRRPAKVHLGEDGKPVTGTFRFLVTEMRIAAPQEIKPLKYARRGTASNLTPKTRPAPQEVPSA
jgi:hypothetical protein